MIPISQVCSSFSLVKHVPLLLKVLGKSIVTSLWRYLDQFSIQFGGALFETLSILVSRLMVSSDRERDSSGLENLQDHPSFWG